MTKAIRTSGSAVMGVLDTVLTRGPTESPGSVLGAVDVYPVALRGFADAKSPGVCAPNGYRQRCGAAGDPTLPEAVGRPVEVHVPGSLKLVELRLGASPTQHLVSARGSQVEVLVGYCLEYRSGCVCEPAQ